MTSLSVITYKHPEYINLLIEDDEYKDMIYELFEIGVSPYWTDKNAYNIFKFNKLQRFKNNFDKNKQKRIIDSYGIYNVIKTIANHYDVNYIQNIIEYRDGKYCETKLYDDMLSYILRKHIDDFEELDL
jgi:hypothetical protein